MKKKQKRLTVLASVGPYAVETLLLVVLPLLYVCLMSIMTRPSYGGVEFTVSFNGYSSLFEKAYLVAIWNSVRMSLLSTIIILLIMNLGRILGSEFDRPFTLSNPLVEGASKTISIFVYERGIKGNQFALSTAVGLFQSVVCVIFLLASNTLAKKFDEPGIM